VVEHGKKTEVTGVAPGGSVWTARR